MKTIIPVLAAANVSIRLAPGQQVQQIVGEFGLLLREAVPPGAELQIELLSSTPAGVVAPGARAVQLGLNAFERALGVRPALIRSGGTLPILAALAEKHVPAILTGFFLPDANIHAPNERLLAEYVPLGTAAAKALFEELGAL